VNEVEGVQMTDGGPPRTSATATSDEIGTILDELSGALQRLDRADLAALVHEVMTAPRVFVTGEGRSGFMARAFAMRLVHLGVTTYFVADTCTPAVADGDVVVGLSGSGTTASTIRVLSAAADHGCRTVAVTSDPSSTLATTADVVVHVPGATKHRRPEEPSTIQPLSSLFDQCAHIALDAVTLKLAELRDVDNDRAVKAHANTE
jgi:6-phospho-3-hexuloisomerase